MNPPAPAAKEPGEVFGDYAIERHLGAGPWGPVFLAREAAGGRAVALKVTQQGHRRQDVEGFLRDAKSLIGISHPNLGEVHAVGEVGRRAYIAGEYFAGGSVADAFRGGCDWPVGRRLEVLRQAAGGLSAAHGRGLVHGRVHPSNLMLTEGGATKVVDIGLGSPATTVAARPVFISPEDLLGTKADVRTDVYLLGLTAFFVLTGELPWFATGGRDNPISQWALLLATGKGKPAPAMGPLPRDLPGAVHAGVRAMCEADPAKRPADMAEVIGILGSPA